MAKPRKPAALKQGKSETKAQLKLREEMEMKLMGSANLIHLVPEHLDIKAQAYYQFLVKELEISGLITNLDVKLLEETAKCMSQLDECTEILKRDGILIYDANENPKEHPTFKTQNTLQVAYRAFANQLGLSPAARAQLAGMQTKAKEDEADPLLQLLKGQ